MDLCSDLAGMSPKPQVTENKGAPLHQTEKLPHSKRNDPQSDKATCKRGEGRCKQLAPQGDRLG